MFDKKELVNDKTGEHYTKYFYTYNESDQIVGILFGHFAPFTGPNGHGRMVTALKNIGAESFFIVTPENNKPFDDEREMFNATQRAEIIQSYLDSEGLNGVALPYKMKRGGAKSQMGPLVALAAEKFGLNIRPVFCFGPDREDLAAEVCNKFGEIKDPTHCEYIVDYERGTSGTKVRQLIKANDIEGICKETGYKTEVAEKLIKLRTENMKMNESKLNESLGPIEIGAIGAYITLLIGAGFGANKLINKAVDFFEKGNEEAKEATGVGIKTSNVAAKAKEYLKILGKKFESEDKKNIKACVDEVIQKYGGKASESTLTQAVIGALKKNYPDTFEKVYKDSNYSPDPRIVKDINKLTAGHSANRTSDTVRWAIKDDYKIKDLTRHNKRNFGESNELNEALPTAAERKAAMERVKNMSIDELIEKYIPKAFINDNGELEVSSHLAGTKCKEELIFSKTGVTYTDIKKDWGPGFVERHWEWKPGDKEGNYSGLDKIATWNRIPRYVIKLIFEKFNREMNSSRAFESIYSEGVEFGEAYKMKEWIGKNSVTLNFSDRDDATEFKAEMKKKFHYPKTRSQYEVVHGTTPSGHAVFVESFKQIYNESCYTPFGSTRMNNMYFCLMTEIEKLRQKDEWPEEVESPLALENKIKELMNDGFSEWEVESYGNELAEYIANELIEDGKCYYN